jgi:hypothetical protein
MDKSERQSYISIDIVSDRISDGTFDGIKSKIGHILNVSLDVIN